MPRSERWKVIKNHPDYAVSSRGRVKRITAARGTRPGKILKPADNGRGYLYVNLQGKNELVHRLVVLSFCRGSKPQVNHKNGVKYENHLRNLIPSTVSENMLHAYRTGLKKGLPHDGERNPNRVLSWAKVNRIRRLYGAGFSQRKLAKRFGVTHVQIGHIVRGEAWRLD